MMVVAVIPYRNEANRIRDVVLGVLDHVHRAVVVDDGSTDETVKEAKAAGADTVSHKWLRHGVGVSTWSGVWRALCLGADIIVTLDGDGQHNPRDIPILIETVLDGADVAVGSRFLENRHNMPAYRRAGNGIITGLHNWRLPISHQLSDSQCGLRAFRREVFRDIRLSDDGFGFLTELTMKATAIGLKIVEVPVRCVYHDKYSDNSSMGAPRHGLIALLRTGWWRVWLAWRGHDVEHRDN